MKLHRKPWKVINQPLRPGMARIIEVQDADGRAVIPWTGFDALDGTKKEKLALAKEIIEAVNARADNKALLEENERLKEFLSTALRGRPTEEDLAWADDQIAKIEAAQAQKERSETQ